MIELLVPRTVVLAGWVVEESPPPSRVTHPTPPCEARVAWSRAGLWLGRWRGHQDNALLRRHRPRVCLSDHMALWFRYNICILTRTWWVCGPLDSIYIPFLSGVFATRPLFVLFWGGKAKKTSIIPLTKLRKRIMCVWCLRVGLYLGILYLGILRWPGRPWK